MLTGCTYLITKTCLRWALVHIHKQQKQLNRLIIWHHSLTLFLFISFLCSLFTCNSRQTTTLRSSITQSNICTYMEIYSVERFFYCNRPHIFVVVVIVWMFLCCIRCLSLSFRRFSCVLLHWIQLNNIFFVRLHVFCLCVLFSNQISSEQSHSGFENRKLSSVGFDTLYSS